MSDIRSHPRRRGLTALLISLLLSGVLPAAAFEDQIATEARSLAADLAVDDVGVVAVVDFTDLQGDVTELGRFLAEELSVALAGQAEGVRVIDRTHLKVLLVEHQLSTTGLIDPETAQELGRLIGVDALITGTVSPLEDTVRLAIKALETETAQIVTSTATNIEKTRAVADLARRGVTAAGGSSAGADGSIEPEETAEVEGFLFELERCELSSQQLECRFVVTNRKQDRYFKLAKYSDAIDTSGNQYRSSEYRLGSGGGPFTFQTLVRDVPIKAAVIFPGVPSDVRRLALLELDCGTFSVQLRNVPVYPK